MYIIDDICYAGSPCEEVHVIEAKPLVGGMLLLLFSSGEKKLFDTRALTEPAFQPLRDESVFNTARVEHGFVSWADGSIDIAPEYVYENGVPYNECDDLLACAS